MPALELIILGTSSPIHTAHRFGNAQVIRGGGNTILIDCGWGATLRLYQAQVRLPTIDHLFYTHLHSDHTTDMADFLVMRWVGGITAPLKVYGPEGTERMTAAYREALSADTGFRFAHHGEKLSPIGTECDVTEIEAGDEPVEVARVGDIVVKAFAVDHRPVMPAYGFRLEREGKSIVISGDTTRCQGLLNGARDADLFVCDSMNRQMMTEFEDNLRRLGNDVQADLLHDAHTYHASTHDAATVAKEAGVKHLVLSHVMPPIAEDDATVARFTEGLSDIYDGPITVTKDLERYHV